MHQKTPHPTQKPEELLRKIVLASSNPGDVVIDPFLGSGTTAVVAEQLKRKWLGCDLSLEYCQWAAERIELVESWSVEKWIAYDLENTQRRQSIRVDPRPEMVTDEQLHDEINDFQHFFTHDLWTLSKVAE
jgi:site-specific DNA-methyltransferase (adenine-specific)